MRNVFRIALEGEQEEKLINFRGPLGQAMTQALNVEYAKKDPVTGAGTELDGGVALESQAQDVTVMQSLVDAVDGSDPETKGIEIYGISEQDVTPDTVVDVVNNMDEVPDREFVVIADATTPEAEDGTGEVEEKTVDIGAASNAAAMEALRSVVKMRGGKLFSSLEDFVESVLEPQPSTPASGNGADGIEPKSGDVPNNPENPSGNLNTPETGGGEGAGENTGGDGTGEDPDAGTHQTNDEASQPGTSVAATE